MLTSFLLVALHAPVPKPIVTKPLSKQDVIGEWFCAYGYNTTVATDNPINYEDRSGYVYYIASDGTYLARPHNSRNSWLKGDSVGLWYEEQVRTWYEGTWKIKGSSVIFYERSYGPEEIGFDYSHIPARESEFIWTKGKVTRKSTEWVGPTDWTKKAP